MESFLKKFESNYREMKTKDLLNRLRLFRIFQNRGVFEGCCELCGRWEKLSEMDKRKLEGMIAALKRELSNRPHLPNKLERKEQRRRRAKGLA